MPRELPLIVGFVSDLLFAVKIENVAQRLGYQVAWIGAAAELGEEAPPLPYPVPGERLSGRAGKLVEQLVRWQPALLIFDLTNDQIPWRQWIANLKSSPATRRLPILCFGPHIDGETAQIAQNAGADAVVARSRFAATLPELIEKHAHTPDTAAAALACAEPLSAQAEQGIALFNQGHYYEAHEELEHAWIADKGAGRDLYRAILQIAVCYLQIERQNYRGAVKMLLRVRQWLNPLPDSCRGVNVARLRQDVQVVYEALVSLGADKLSQFDWSLARPVAFIPSPPSPN